ncbi:hypothetical protein D1872_247040 [compost metagenome]
MKANVSPAGQCQQALRTFHVDPVEILGLAEMLNFGSAVKDRVDFRQKQIADRPYQSKVRLLQIALHGNDAAFHPLDDFGAKIPLHDPLQPFIGILALHRADQAVHRCLGRPQQFIQKRGTEIPGSPGKENMLLPSRFQLPAG